MLHHASLPTSVPKELCTVLCVVSSVTFAAVGFMKLLHFHTVLLFCQVITSVSLLLFTTLHPEAEQRAGWGDSCSDTTLQSQKTHSATWCILEQNHI